MAGNTDTPNYAEIADLIRGFSANIREMTDTRTHEAVVRQEYIDPFFEALGWDVGNTRHRSPAEKDAVIEALVGTIESGRLRSRRPDYLFRIDGFPKLIVEAKQPSVDLVTDHDDIFQARTYVWNAQIPFAILTGFEELRLVEESNVR